MELQRFVSAQDDVYGNVLEELARGRKVAHWMWFVFPQLRGLGTTPTSVYFGLESVAHAEHYPRHVRKSETPGGLWTAVPWNVCPAASAGPWRRATASRS